MYLKEERFWPRESVVPRLRGQRELGVLESREAAGGREWGGA